jgi:hypothetical protein
MLADAEIGRVATEILKSRLSDAGFRDLDVASDEDYDGAPIIRMIAHFDGPIGDMRKFIDSTAIIRAQLLRSGDDRFIFLTHDFPGAADEDDGERGSADKE